MSRSYTLSNEHYASKWAVPEGDAFYVLESVNELAIFYANQPDGPLKEEPALKLVECFHGYLIKYTNMVIRGQLPNLKSPLGKDATEMLRKLLPKKTVLNQSILAKTCRTLHLAFKTQTTDEIYDVMVMCFLRACRRYDPHYTDKVRQVCEALDGKKVRRQFTADDVATAIGFDALGCIRMLVKKQYLAAIVGAKRKVIGYKRGPEWPPEPAFLESGPIGFTYFAQMWFRYYLAEHIGAAMDEIESKAGMLQLGHRTTDCNGGQGGTSIAFAGMPSANGNFIDGNGNVWATDMALMESQLDVSEMTDKWVRGTSDKLFHGLTPTERWLLQMVFRKELNWVEISKALQCSTQTARQMYTEILKYLKGHAGVKEEVAA